MTETPRIEINGVSPTAVLLRAAAHNNYGHFTAMQVRNLRVRGLELHLARLAAANREVFGAALDTGAVRDHIRHALGRDTRDAFVRVYVLELQDRPAVMVTVRPPGGRPEARGSSSQSLISGPSLTSSTPATSGRATTSGWPAATGSTRRC